MPDHRFAFLIHRAQRILFSAIDRELKATLGITSAQLGALYYLKGHTGCLLSDLSRGLELNNSAITGIVNRMVRTGLVTKHTSAADRRACEVRLTDRGNQLVEQARPLLATFNENLQAGFSEAELAIAANFLETAATRFALRDSPHREEVL